MNEHQFKDKKPFQRYHEKKKLDTFNVYLNDGERETLNKCKLILEQTKDSTALKQLAWLGANMLNEQKVKYLLASLFKNKKKNERLGVIDFD